MAFATAGSRQGFVAIYPTKCVRDKAPRGFAVFPPTKYQAGVPMGRFRDRVSEGFAVFGPHGKLEGPWRSKLSPLVLKTAISIYFNRLQKRLTTCQMLPLRSLTPFGVSTPQIPGPRPSFAPIQPPNNRSGHLVPDSQRLSRSAQGAKPACQNASNHRKFKWKQPIRPLQNPRRFASISSAR